MHSTMLTFCAVTSGGLGGGVAGGVWWGTEGGVMCCSPVFSRTVIGVNGGKEGGMFFFLMHFSIIIVSSKNGMGEQTDASSELVAVVGAAVI